MTIFVNFGGLATKSVNPLRTCSKTLLANANTSTQMSYIVTLYAFGMGFAQIGVDGAKGGFPPYVLTAIFNVV